MIPDTFDYGAHELAADREWRSRIRAEHLRLGDRCPCGNAEPVGPPHPSQLGLSWHSPDGHNGGRGSWDVAYG